MWTYFGNKGSTLNITLARASKPANVTIIATGVAIELQRSGGTRLCRMVCSS